MNKQIKKIDLDRIKKCIVEAKNMISCYKETGIATHTISRILKRGFAKDTQLQRLLDYCDKVENKTIEA